MSGNFRWLNSLISIHIFCVERKGNHVAYQTNHVLLIKQAFIFNNPFLHIHYAIIK